MPTLPDLSNYTKPAVWTVIAIVGVIAIMWAFGLFDPMYTPAGVEE